MSCDSLSPAGTSLLGRICALLVLFAQLRVCCKDGVGTRSPHVRVARGQEGFCLLLNRVISLSDVGGLLHTRFVRRPSAFQIAGLPVRLQTSGRA